jgi:hypothetical protein
MKKNSTAKKSSNKVLAKGQAQKIRQLAAKQGLTVGSDLGDLTSLIVPHVGRPQAVRKGGQFSTDFSWHRPAFSWKPRLTRSAPLPCGPP